jgi:excisionase family DNA binding protein
MSRQRIRPSSSPQSASSSGSEADEGTTIPVDAELLTYRDAAKLLKVSHRTIERWTREALIPYIRLPQRGAWSGVRFSRMQLLRWLRQRTVREQ